MRKSFLRPVLHVTAFCLALLIAVALAGHYLMPHSNRYLSGYTAGGILGEDFDTIDVLVMGDSNAAQGISPMEWYNAYGITGYTYGSGWLTVYSIYYRLQNILKEQAPKVVVLGTGTVYSKRGNETYLQCALGDITDELFPLLRFHDNWKYLTLDNMLEEHDYSWRDANKGYTPITEVSAYTGGSYMYNPDTPPEEIPLLARLYLDRIVTLCRDNGCELLLITVPTVSWSMARHNGIRDYAEQQGLTYIDYNLDSENPGIDWRTDTPDSGAHLNVLGARKLSQALGKVLADSGQIPDHRGQPGYEDWDADAQSYLATMEQAIPENEAKAAAQLEVLGQTA